MAQGNGLRFCLAQRRRDAEREPREGAAPSAPFPRLPFFIRTRLRPPHVDEKTTLMNAASIAQYINGGVVGRGLSSRKVSLAMGRLGFKNVHTKAGNFFEVYQIPVNEIKPTLAYVDEREAGASSLPAMTEGDLPF